MISPRSNGWAGLPGADLVVQGLDDLSSEQVSDAALLLLVAEPRLAALDIPFPSWRPNISGPAEHALYSWLEEQHGAEAYTRYNSLLRRLNSFAHALEREKIKG